MKQEPVWITEFADAANKYALLGDYKRGAEFAKRVLRQHPDEVVVRYMYAKLLGDWADELPPARRKKLKAEAVRILRPLLRRISHLPLKRRFGICINYYYQAYDFRAMHAFGRRLARQDRRLGLYAQGVGACELASSALAAGKVARAKAWALKGKKIWERYGLKGEPYYFPHYLHARALAITGDKKSALRSLKTAAKVSKRKVTTPEFKDVLALLEG